jgi:hypothetical protein
MKTMVSLCGWVAAGATAVAWGAEFPLEYKTLTSEKAMALPGGYGAYGQLQSVKPSSILKEPKFASKYPLYGLLREGSNAKGMAYRLDESKGDGTGYNELILDFNRNGDLTDDPIGKLPADKVKSLENGPRPLVFDPLKAPADKKVGIWEPLYSAEVFIYNPKFRTASGGDNPNVGQIRLKTACYLEGKVEVNGEKYLVGLVDGNVNFKLGDPSKSQAYRTDNADNYYFMPGDYLLLDANKNGSFDNDQFDTESAPLAPVMYFGEQPCEVSLAPDYKTIKVEPFANPLAVLEIKPEDNRVRHLSLARETSPGNWEQLNAPVKDGKIKVLPGNYDVSACVVKGGDKPGENMTAMASKTVFRSPVAVEEGKTAAIQCGTPLEIQVTAEKQGAKAARLGGLMGAAASLFTGYSGGQLVVNINMSVVGAGGEKYSSYSNGRDPQLPKPAFAVMDESGKKVASGSLEYG